MAHNLDPPLNPPSPRSSTGAVESLKGTPDTHLMTFSPGLGSGKSSSTKLPSDFISVTSSPNRFPVDEYHSAMSQADRDPFVTPIHGSRLSPTASSFCPVLALAGYSPPRQGISLSMALSTELGITRHIAVSSQDSLSVMEVERCLMEMAERGKQLQDYREVEFVENHVQIHFRDIRDACMACSQFRQTRREWTVQYVGVRDNIGFQQETNILVTEHGQLLVMAHTDPGSVTDAVQAMEIARCVLQACGHLFAFVKQASFSDGSFRAIIEYCNPDSALKALKNCDGLSVEGINLTLRPLRRSSSSDIATAFQGISLGSDYPEQRNSVGLSGGATSTMSLGPRVPIYPLMVQSSVIQNVPYALDRIAQASQNGRGAPLSPAYSMNRPVYQTPPSPAPTTNKDYSPARVPSYGRIDARRQNATRITRVPYHNTTSHHNHVDISRIRDGIDVRTTIMLRNIPNKVDQAMLKRIVDDSSWGKYDFMYLRIDFANDCNVGYAFINFVDPLDIIDFVNSRGNQRWNCFKSDKVAEVSYASKYSVIHHLNVIIDAPMTAIQGKDCLVQKFRNSSVMLEAPHYRPKLYYTSNGPTPEMAGQEETFPGPDNQSKMKRSCENAEHVGLFTPNAGQHFRDEQRRRRSQYDRGTRLAALEEYDYETAIQQFYGTPT